MLQVTFTLDPAIIGVRGPSPVRKDTDIVFTNQKPRITLDVQNNISKHWFIKLFLSIYSRKQSKKTYDIMSTAVREKKQLFGRCTNRKN